MSDSKLVTQIMCYYNEQKYLRDAVNSILNQSYTNWELILIDDGSTDKSAEIADSFSDERIVQIHNKKNHGLAWCRNQGLSLAKGDYVGFVDADDIASSDKLRKMADYLDKHEDILVVSGGHIFMDKYGNKRGKVIPAAFEDIDIRAYMLFQNCIAGPCALFRRSVIDEYHVLHDTKMRTSQDYFFWHECLRYGKFHNLNTPLFYYRVGHNSQAKRRQAKNPKETEDIFLKIFNQAWRFRGFHLTKNEVEYIYKHFYREEPIRSFVDCINGCRLYYKIKKQIEALQLAEGKQILTLSRKYLKNGVKLNFKNITKKRGL